jgi:hypothetical protein
MENSISENVFPGGEDSVSDLSIWVENVKIEFRGCSKVLHEYGVILGAERWRVTSNWRRYILYL